MLIAQLEVALFEEVSLDKIEAYPVRRGFQYWTELCGGRRFPMRDELKPSVIRDVLSNLVLVRVLGGARDFHLSIVGDEVQRAYAVPLNNRLLSDIVKTAPAIMPGWRERYRRTAISGVPYYYRVTPRLEFGEANFIRREAVVLPLGQDGRVTHLVTFGKQELKPGA